MSSKFSYSFQHIFISFLKVLTIANRDDNNVIGVLDINKIILYFLT